MVNRAGNNLMFNSSRIYGITLIVVLGGFLFGHDTAVISGTVESLNNFFVIPIRIGEKFANSLLGLIVSSALIGCFIGSTIGGLLSHKLGRKKTLLFSSILFIASCIGSAWPEIGFAGFGKCDDTVLIPFKIYRILGGMGIGIASILLPMYIAEISPSEIRGKLVLWYQMSIVTGIMAVCFVNFLISSQEGEDWLHQLGWRWMFASEFIPVFLFFSLLWTVPESPRWLALSGKKEKAFHILSVFNGEQKAKNELKSILETYIEQSGKLFSFGFK